MLDYEYEALSDYVSVENSKKFIDDLKKKDEDFTYYISMADKGESQKKTSETVLKRPVSKSNFSTYAAIVVVILFMGGFWLNTRKRA